MSGTNALGRALEKRRDRALGGLRTAWTSVTKKKIKVSSAYPELGHVSSSQQSESQQSSGKAGLNIHSRIAPTLFSYHKLADSPGVLTPPVDDPVSPRITATGLAEREPEILRDDFPANPDQVPLRDPIIPEPTQQLCVPTEEARSGTDSHRANALWDQALAGLDPKKRRFLPIDEGIRPLNIDSLIEIAGAKKDQCVEKRWKFQVGGTTYDLTEKAENIISCVNKLKKIGDVAVQHDSGHAALSWAAIRLVLQVRENVESRLHN